MELTTAWWLHAVIAGGIASAASAAVLVGVLCVAPYAFLSDHPADIRAAAEPPTPAQSRRGRIGGVLFLLTLLGSFAAVVVSWRLAHPAATFVELALMSLLTMLIFILVDLLIVDWLIICTWRPRAMVLPGTEDCAGWRDRRHHLREQLRPKAIIVPTTIALALAGIAWLVGLLFG